jgi:hypothetical protein
VRQAAIRAAARAAPGVEGKNVLRAVALYADRRGVARPSVAALALDTGLHRRNVQRALRKLEECGRLLRLRASFGGRGRANEWMVLAPSEDLAAEPETAASPPPFDDGNRGTREPETAAMRALNRGVGAAPRLEPEDKNPEGVRGSRAPCAPTRAREGGDLRRVADYLLAPHPDPTSDPQALLGILRSQGRNPKDLTNEEEDPCPRT